jgi:predicted CoA-binding protein
MAAMRARPPEIEQFLAAGSFAVVGASADRRKYGNKVLRCYLQHGMQVVAVNPRETEVEGVRCRASLRDVPADVRAASVIVPPAGAGRVVDDALARGIRHLWFQPGAEHPEAIARARAAGIAVIAGGPCLLVALGFRDE